jgi:hypothetical protein
MHRLFGLLFSIFLGCLGITSASFAQDSLNVRRLAEIYHPWIWYAWDVALADDRAYVCSWGHGLSVVDISHSNALIEIGQFVPPC